MVKSSFLNCPTWSRNGKINKDKNEVEFAKRNALCNPRWTWCVSCMHNSLYKVESKRVDRWSLGRQGPHLDGRYDTHLAKKIILYQVQLKDVRWKVLLANFFPCAIRNKEKWA